MIMSLGPLYSLKIFMKDDEVFYKFIGKGVQSFLRVNTLHLDDPEQDLVEIENVFMRTVTDSG